MADVREFVVDFNELLEPDLVLFSRGDLRKDSAGNEIELVAGMNVAVTMEDQDKFGQRDDLVASGVLELNTATGWASDVKWCCRIDRRGIRNRSES
jgi:hypothetical protein